MRIEDSGNVGIGTTTPWKKLSVTGAVGFDGLAAGAGVGSLCLTANKEVVYSDNAGCTGSSQRFKHSIETLDATSGIQEAMKLRPVSFVYNDDIGVKGPQVGFIAEDVAQVDQRLVTYDASSTPANVKYQNMVAITIKAIQDIWNTIAGFADHFTTKELTFTRVTGDDLTLTHQICIQKSDGTPVCVTGDQLANILSTTGRFNAIKLHSPSGDPEPVNCSGRSRQQHGGRGDQHGRHSTAGCHRINNRRHFTRPVVRAEDRQWEPACGGGKLPVQ
jgi:hypothetical protein